jgi:hypothetical protein
MNFHVGSKRRGSGRVETMSFHVGSKRRGSWQSRNNELPCR